MVIQINNLNFVYENSDSGLFDINLQIKENECVALIGQSGNGKTTLTRVINGLAPAHYKGTLTGQICIHGQSVNQTELWAHSKTVGSVFQDPKSQFFSSELYGEVAFGLENFGYSNIEIKEKVDAIIDAQRLGDLKTTSLDRLSSGEKQKVAISSVLALSPTVLVFDEPTANLDEPSAHRLGELIAELKHKGHTIVIAEHRLSHIAGFVDRYLYLKDGRIEREFTPAQLQALCEAEKQAMGIREITPAQRKKLPQLDCDKADPFVVAHAQFQLKKKTILSDLSFSVPSAAVVAITGENGVGKTTLAKLLCGLHKLPKGAVSIGGKPVKSSQLYRHVWYSSNDTNTQFFTDSLTEELLLLTPKTLENLENARAILQEIGLYTEKDRHPQTLSGGQKQRLSIACGMLSGRNILIFDEPTSGLDGKNLAIVARLFQQMAAQGKIVLLITHDNELINACCTHQLPL